MVLSEVPANIMRTDVEKPKDVSIHLDVNALIEGVFSKHGAKLTGLHDQDAKEMATEIASVLSAHFQQHGILGPIMENRAHPSADVKQNNADPFVGAQFDLSVQGTSATAVQDTGINLGGLNPSMESMKEADTGLHIAMSYADASADAHEVKGMTVVCM